MTTRLLHADGWHPWRGVLRCCLCAVALAGAATASGTRAAAAPQAPPTTFTLMPADGPCGRSVTASGAGYLPGSTVDIRGPFVPGTAINLASRSGVPQPVITVGADGTFTLSLLPCTAATEGADRPGMAYLWTAETTGPQRVFANAYFTVAPATFPGLPNTGGGGSAGGQRSVVLPLELGALLFALGAAVVACGRHRTM